jgi:GxxExxY protein
MEYLHKDLTDKIIKCFYEVYNTLGYGFLEKVYEVSLFEELTRNGIYCERQKKIEVFL